jgi:hypothetical protein
MSACVCTNGPASTTPFCRRTFASTPFQSVITRSSPYVMTRMSGLPIRIFSRRSVCSPSMTPMMTMSALTATVTPRIAIVLMSDSRRDPRRLRM